MFGTNSVMSNPFFDATFSQFVNTIKGTSVDNLSETEKTETKALWEKYKKDDREKIKDLKCDLSISILYFCKKFEK